MLKVLLTVGALQVLTMLVMMVRTKVLALLLGPEQYGLMGALDRLVAVFAQTASLSLPFAALRYLSPLWHEDRDRYRRLFVQMRDVLFVLLLVAFVVGVASAVFAPELFSDELSASPWLLVMALCGIPVAGAIPFLKNVIASGFDHHRSMLFSLGHAVILTVTAVVGVVGWGLTGFYGLYAVAALLLVVVVTVRVGRSVGAGAPIVEAPRRRPRLALPPHVWRFSLLMLLPAFLAPAVAYGVYDEVIDLHGEHTAGFMQAAMGIALAVRGVLGAAHQVFFTPHVNRDGAFAERAERASEFHKTFMFLVGVVVPPLLLVSPFAIAVLYSRAFVPGAEFVVLFVVTEILALSVGTYQALLIALDHIGYQVAINVASQLVMYLVAYLFVRDLGIAGAGLAGLACQVWLGVFALGFLRVRHGLRIPVRVVLLTFYVFSTLTLSGWLGGAYFEFDLRTVLVGFGVWGAMAALLYPFLSATDRANLTRLLRSVRARFGAPPPSATS